MRTKRKKWPHPFDESGNRNKTNDELCKSTD